MPAAAGERRPERARARGSPQPRTLPPTREARSNGGETDRMGSYEWVRQRDELTAGSFVATTKRPAGSRDQYFRRPSPSIGYCHRSLSLWRDWVPTRVSPAHLRRPGIEPAYLRESPCTDDPCSRSINTGQGSPSGVLRPRFGVDPLCHPRGHVCRTVAADTLRRTPHRYSSSATIQMASCARSGAMTIEGGRWR